MAVTFDAVGPSASGTGANGQPLTWSHTTGTGADRYLVVGVAFGIPMADATATTAATYNGVAMSSLGKVKADNQPNGYCELFGLANPPSGAHTVAVTGTLQATETPTLTGGSVSFAGASQSDPTAVTAFGDSASPRVTVDSAAGQMVVDIGCSGVPISGSQKTQRWRNNFSTHSGAGCAAMSTADGAASVTMGYTTENDWWGIAAVAIAEPSTSPPNSGTATGGIAWTGSATGTAPEVPEHSGSAAGGIVWSGAATGAASHSGAAAGAVSWSGAAEGSTGHAGSATGTVAWSGTAEGSTGHSGAAVGTLTWAGAAEGSAARSGSATGGIAWSGAASGTAPTVGEHHGSAAGSIAWAGSAEGSATHSGTATGAIAWTGTASGTAPVVGQNSGRAAGSISWTGTASGSATRSGTAVGGIFWTGTGTGTADHAGTATGALSWAGVASGSAPTVGGNTGTAAGAITWTGTATGTASHSGTAAGSLTWTGAVETGEITDMTVIQNVLTDTSGAGVAGKKIRVRLHASSTFLSSLASEVVESATATTDDDGNWSLHLTPTGDYLDSGAFYIVEELLNRWKISVPSTGGPYTVGQCLISTPSDSAINLSGAISDDANNAISWHTDGLYADIPSETEVSADDITDATTVGVGVLTAADAAAARSAIGAGTSNVAIEDGVNPHALGAAAPGTAESASASDHVHRMPAIGSLNGVNLADVADGEVLVYDGGSENVVSGSLSDIGAAAAANLPLNVKDYGAVGDGTTDDSAAIQSAIDAATAAGGGGILIPPATYLIGTGLTISPLGLSSKLAIFAYGAILNYTGDADALLINTNIAADDIQDGEKTVHTYGLHITGTSSATAGIRNYGCTRASFNDTTLDGFTSTTEGDAALILDARFDFWIEECHFNGLEIKNSGNGICFISEDDKTNDQGFVAASCMNNTFTAVSIWISQDSGRGLYCIGRGGSGLVQIARGVFNSVIVHPADAADVIAFDLTAAYVEGAVFNAPGVDFRGETVTGLIGFKYTGTNTLTLIGPTVFPVQEGTVNFTGGGRLMVLAGNEPSTFTADETGNVFMPSLTLGTDIYDANGKAWIHQAATASAVNQLEIGNAATDGSPYLTADGTDSNIGLNIFGKGTGVVEINGTVPMPLPATLKTQYAVEGLRTDGGGGVYAANIAGCGQIQILTDSVITGICFYNGGVIDGNMLVMMYDATGALVASSGSTAQAGSFAMQQVPFTAAYTAAAGIYYIAVMPSSATATFGLVCCYGLSISAAPGTFTVPESITVPTDIGDYIIAASTY